MCKCRIGSYTYDDSTVKFRTGTFLGQEKENDIVHYVVDVKPLDIEDRTYLWIPTGSNYSLAGFEVTFSRHITKHMMQYYVTSCLFVVVSWVRKIFAAKEYKPIETHRIILNL